MQSDVYGNDVHHVDKGITFKAVKTLVKEGIIKANLMPAFAAGFLAVMYYGQSFFANIPVLLFMVFATALVIGGVAALNNFYDRDIDSVMESKLDRPSVDGTFNAGQILTIGFSMLIAGEIILFMINPTAGTLGLVAAFGYAVVYSIYAKRHLLSNTVIGAIPGAMPPLIGWAVIDPGLHMLAWAMFIVMFIWQPPHFYALAIRRSDEYSKAGVPMLPSVKGNHRTRVSIIFWVALLLFTPLLMMELGLWFAGLVTLLNAAWLMVALNRFRRIEDYNRYAGRVFVFSLNYIIIFFVMIIIAGLLFNF
ncbi:MAG TPA: heme o synthase [Candidatus Salinicoccus stercoripullorum]|uniref:Protoheme IX farnesyltransferase n=1 Tax=Candidatus Salinicoccus stercoripullorum TaxID=2838756 RepID=A0A9D1QGJ4_9STAP|nr:heme o synthase [Candidatus Salinicoccus stercoripullorum]